MLDEPRHHHVVFGLAVAVVNGESAHPARRLHRGAEIDGVARFGLDEEDLAIGAHGADHVEIDGSFDRPTGVRRSHRIRRQAIGVDHFEATVGRRAGRETELLAVDIHVRFGVRVVKAIDDGHETAVATRGRYPVRRA